MSSPSVPAGRPRARLLVHVLGQFPQISETFIWQEVAGLLRSGLPVVPISTSKRPELDWQDAEARFAMERTSYPPASPAGVIREFAEVLLRHPLAVVRLALLNHAYPILPGHSRLRRLARAIPVLRAAARLHPTHLHGHWTIPSDIAMLVARTLKTSYSWSAHAHDIYDEGPLVLGDGGSRGLRGKVEGARFVLSCTEAGRARLGELVGSAALDRVILHHHGVDTDRFSPDPGADSRDPPLLVSVGRLVRYKGFDRLLEILAHVAESGTPFRCLIVGEGSRGPALQETAAALGLSARVGFAGRQSPAEVRDLLRRADLFILTADPEAGQRGLPNVLVEAMSAGLPTLSTSLPAVTELIEDGVNGLLLPADPGQAARLLVTLLRDRDLRHRLGGKAREKVLAEHDLRRQTAVLAKRFDELVEGTG